MYLSTKTIQKKYNYTLKDLFLHYAALGGEIPAKLIDELGITPHNKNYITRSSSFTGFFEYKKGGGLRGYQLHIKGINYLLKTNKEYSTFITNDSGKRKITSDLSKRKRYQRRAWLFHYFDELEINYFPSQAESRNFFFCSKTLKKLYAKFAKEKNISDNLRVSSIYGTLKLEYDLYNVYVFDDSFEKLSAAREFKTHSLIADAFQRDSVETIIIVRDAESQAKLLSEILNSMISTDKKYNRNPYLFFKESKQNGLGNIHILSFDDVGKNQLASLKHRTEVNAKIRLGLLEYSSMTRADELKLSEKDGIKCDARLLNQPCFYAYSLDIYRIKRAYDILLNNKNVVVHFICFEVHIPALKKLFSEMNLDARVEFICIK